VYMVGKIAVCQIQNLAIAYKERFDRNNFFQNLLLDNMLLVDIYNRAKKLHVDVVAPRAVFLIETRLEKDSIVMELLKGMFSSQSGDYITAVDESNVILIKTLEQTATYENLCDVAHTIVAMMNAEAMLNVRVTFGTVVQELKDVSKSYKEAKLALDVGKIFYAEHNVVAYSALGIGRLIYQLPINLCRIFIEEIFGSNVPNDLDEETLITINKFFENNLNVSETSRQLFVHRNTLVYRIEKIQRSTGLDLRNFDDALTFKIALMVVNYMKYLDSLEY
ncbi:MAG: helix-turn-helix domain-containing protein, partial [Acetatifactor sp.]|nr:helix-turn-helix domain-containing protein [Acetatifactor sp.]